MPSDNTSPAAGHMTTAPFSLTTPTLQMPLDKHATFHSTLSLLLRSRKYFSLPSLLFPYSLPYLPHTLKPCTLPTTSYLPHPSTPGLRLKAPSSPPPVW